MIEATQHSIKRARERLGIKKQALTTLLVKVEEKGDLFPKGGAKRYIAELKLQKRDIDKFIIYGEFIYLVSHGKLVTIYNMPRDIVRSNRRRNNNA